MDALIDAFPVVDRCTPEEARRATAAARDARPAPSRTPVSDVCEHEVPVNGGRIACRLYRGSDAESLPTLVFAHGGGWTMGDLDSHDEICRAIAARAGIAVFAVDYRLAPEHPFPTGLHDLHAAARWVEGHSELLGVDEARIAIGGDSSGGNLAAAAALLARDLGAPHYRMQLLIYPVLDPCCGSTSQQEIGEGYFLTTAALRWYWGHYLSSPADRQNPLAAPARATRLEGLPSAFVLTAEFDPLRDEGELYANRLRRAGIPVTCRRMPDMFHGFFGLGAILPDAHVAVDAVAGALRGALLDGPVGDRPFAG